MKGTLDDFAKEYGLELSIQLRHQLPPGDPARFYAKLNNVDIIVGDGCLLGTFGDGPTPEAAVEDYAKQISEKQLSIISSKFGRLEIQAWEFVQNDNQTVDSIATNIPMSLRDYFASQAMNGMLSYSYCSPSHGNYTENCSVEGVANRAYDIADAMLKARQS